MVPIAMKKNKKKYIHLFSNVLEWTENLNFNTAIWFSQKSKVIHFGQLELIASGSKNAEKENKKISQRTKIHSELKWQKICKIRILKFEI